MTTKNYTVDFLKEKLKGIFAQFKPLLVYYFGSAARSKTGPMSDIDLAFLWPKAINAPLVKSLELQAAIKEILADERFEVGSLNGQNLSFAYTVISTGVAIYGAKEERVAYETKLLSEYLDFNYLAEIYNKTFDERIRKSYG